MRRCIICIFLLSGMFFSCAPEDFSWPDEPVGAFYFDGKEYRETTTYYWESGYFVGHLTLRLYYNNNMHDDDYYYFGYLPSRFISEDKDDHIGIQWMMIRFPLSLFDSQITLSDTDESIFIEGLSFYENTEQYRNYYEILSFEINISDITPSQKMDDDYNCRIDYQMVVKDTEGVQHQVYGWAVSDERRGKGFN